MTSNGTYNHRSHPPTTTTRPIAPNPTRIIDALEAIKQEVEVLQSERDAIRAQRDEYEAQITSQINEVNVIRRSLYDLEVQQGKTRQQYEEELRRLRNELAALRQSAANAVGGPSSHVPPGIPGLQPLSNIGTSRFEAAPASPVNSFNRERDHERGKEKAHGRTPSENERDWESRQKVRDTRDTDRIADIRDPKRMKPEPPAPESNPPPEPGKLPSAYALYSSAGPGPSSNSARAPTREPPEYQLAPINTNLHPVPPEELSLNTATPEFKKEGTDWFAVFNPQVKRTLDISLVHTLIHQSVVCCVQFSADGRFLATGCNRTAQIYDVKTGIKTCVLADDSAGKTGDLYIRSVRFSPDGKLLATGAEDRQIRIWDIAKKCIRTIFDGHQQEIYSLDFSRDGRLIVSGSGDKTARIWDISADGGGGCCSRVLTISDADALGNDAGVTSVAISPDGRLVAAGSLDTVVRLWDVATGVLLERLRGHRDSVYSVAFTPDGRGLVSGSLDKTLKYWDVSAIVAAGGVKGRKEGAIDMSPKRPGEKPGPSPCTMNFVGHKDYVLSVAVSHDGKWVVSGSKDRCVQFWDSRTAALQFMLQGHKNSVISLDVNPAGGMLATGSGDNLARIWRYTSF